MLPETAVPTTEYPSPADIPEPTGAEAEAAALAEKGEGIDVQEAVSPEGEAAVEVVVEAPKVEPSSQVIAKARERETIAEAKIREAEETKKSYEEKSKLFSKDEIIKNPTKFFAETGLDLQALAEAVLAEGQPPPAKDAGQIALEKLEAIEKKEAEEKAAKQKQDDENQQAYINKAVSDHRAIVSDVVDKNPDKYELIKAYDQKDLVTEIVMEHWNQTKTLLPLEEALDAAENFLEERTAKALNTTKIKAKFQTEPKKESSDKIFAKTLNNSMAGGSEIEAPSGRRLSKDERLKKASSKLVITPD